MRLHSMMLSPDLPVRVLYSVRSPHFIPSLYFIPSPQSVVRSPQSVFYTDRAEMGLSLSTLIDIYAHEGEKQIISLHVMVNSQIQLTY